MLSKSTEKSIKMKLKLSAKELTNKVHNVQTPSSGTGHYKLPSTIDNKLTEIGCFENNDNIGISSKNAIQNAQQCKSEKLSKLIISTKVKQTFLSTENIEDIFIACRNNPDLVPEEIKIGYFLILVLGIKQTDLHSAKWQNICLKNKLFNLYIDDPMVQNFSIPIPNHVIPVFEKLKELSTGSEYLFPNKNKLGHIYSNAFRLHLLKLFGKSASNKKVRDNLLGDIGVPEFSVSNLRKSCASLMSQLHVSPLVVAQCFNVNTPSNFKSFIDHDYVNERRKAHELLANIILPISLSEYV